MFNSLSLEEFTELSKKKDRVALFKEYSADVLTPIAVYQALEKNHPEIVLLESAEKEEHVGRFSFIGFDPVAEIKASGRHIEKRVGDEKSQFEGDPLEELRKMKQLFDCASETSLKGFVGGAFGYLGYDAVRFFEEIPERHKEQKSFPDLYFQFHDSVISFDHVRKVLCIVTIIQVGENPKIDYEKGLEKLEELYREISHPVSMIPTPRKGHVPEVSVDIDDEAFKKIVDRAKKYIVRGDVFQVVPSRTFSCELTVSPFEIYRALRFVSPAPYMFFLKTEEFTLAGASPEKLVSVEGDLLETIPLAGTRPRMEGTRDFEMEEDLKRDEKEIAEHMMLVDLGRNDLGKVSLPGSVHVTRLAEVQRFSHVMHLASFVQGRLRPDFDALDALTATFPAGTLTGAPKIRAMEIIDELEVSPRGPYGGAICMLDHKGNLETCIGIRMMVIKDQKAYVRAGCGVVYDSDPQSEADETRQKARSCLEAIRVAEEGLL